MYSSLFGPYCIDSPAVETNAEFSRDIKNLKNRTRKNEVNESETKGEVTRKRK